MIRLCAAEAHHRHAAGWDDVSQHLPGPNRWQLVDVADDQEGSSVGHRPHEGLHQQDVDHRCFVHDQQIAIERIVRVALETASPGVDLQEPVDGL